MSKEYICLIPLRAGSKGVPQKNLKLLRGIPLYQHTLFQAQRIGIKTYISTNIAEILNNPPPQCTLIQRPADLATDDTPMEKVVSHLIRAAQANEKHIVLLQATSPLRNDEDINAAMRLYNRGQHNTVLTVTPADSTILKMGFFSADTFTPVSSPAFCFENRQQLPRIVRPNGAVFIFSAKDFLNEGNKIPTSSIGAVSMPADRSIDLDKPEDFFAAEAALSNHKTSTTS